MTPSGACVPPRRDTARHGGWDQTSGCGLRHGSGARHSERTRRPSPRRGVQSGRWAPGLGRRHGSDRADLGRPAVTAETQASIRPLASWSSFLPSRCARPMSSSTANRAIAQSAGRSLATALAERYREETTCRSIMMSPGQSSGIRMPMSSHASSPHQMTAACSRAPDMAATASSGHRSVPLGRFHKERFPDALATLSKCDDNHPQRWRSCHDAASARPTDQPAPPSAIAQTHEGPRFTADAEALDFLREAAR